MHIQQCGYVDMFESATRTHQKLSHTIVALYVITLLILGVGAAFALHQNWQIRLEASHNNLMRSANMGNLLVETALQNASKNLHATQAQIRAASQRGWVSNAHIHRTLKAAQRDFDANNARPKLNLLIHVNAVGLAYARSDVLLTRPMDMAAHFFYTDLRDHPTKQKTVGPLLKAHTAGAWVFHIAVPMRDAQGAFAGVLVQQLFVKDIASDLAKYSDLRSFEQMLTHYPGSAASFFYPAPKDDTSNWLRTHTRKENLLIGFSQSPQLALTTYAAIPMQRVLYEFIQDNMYFFAYVVAGFVFITAVFLYLLHLSKQLMLAQISSRNDPLTHLNNRRALDEQLPHLMRESMREQTPVTVLFIDIDNFRLFNEHYGHESGDVALLAVATALASVCQRPLDFICRWGGEEFVAVLPNTNTIAAQKISQDMLNATRALKLHVPHHTAPRITVSIGYVTRTIKASTLELDLVGMADLAMLQAKEQGRNQSVMAAASTHSPQQRITCSSA